MAAPVEDRRVRRSKSLIVRAFADLVLEKEYGRLTVQDIIDRADVGRSTFYAHFRDKEAVLLSCFDEVEAGLAALAEGSEEPPQHSPASIVMKHAWDHKRIYRTVCASSASAIVQRHLRQMMLPILEHSLPTSTEPVQRGIAREFYVSALVGLLVWWVSTDFRISPDDLAGEFQKLAVGVTGGGAE